MLAKQAVSINFVKGLNQKVDPFQLEVGNFVSLDNSTFDKLGRLTKRNGFPAITSLPDTTSRYVTTFNNNLTAIGTDIKSYSQGANIWTKKGYISPLQMSTLPLVRSSTNQVYVDTAIAPNGLVCTTYIDQVPTLGSVTLNIVKYMVADTTTGVTIIPPTPIVSTFGTVSYSAKAFSLNNNFVLVFPTLGAAGAYHLEYFTVNSYNPSIVGSVTTFSTSIAPAAGSSFDGVVANNTLFVAWNSAASAGVTANYLTAQVTLGSPVVVSSSDASIISTCADITGSTPVIWTSTYVAGSNTGRYVAFNPGLNTLFASKQFVSSSTQTIVNLASNAQGGNLNLLYEVTNSYSYDISVPTNFIKKIAVTQTGSQSASTTFIRGLGLASKAFLISSQSYVWTSYQSQYQPTYFMINSAAGVVAKLAYGNGGGYLTNGLPSVAIASTSASFGYLFKDLVTSVNKETMGVSSQSQVSGVYTQTGVNLATVNLGTTQLNTSEVGGSLNLTGGFLNAYDGNIVTENGFHLYPDNVEASPLAMLGSMTSQTYFYQATYEWTDNQGNIFKSAPSIAVSAISSALSFANVMSIPTLRVTNKIANPPKISIYRWSVAQPVFYQVTSLVQPIINDQTVDYVSYVDRSSDAAILGNDILYTNGGVVENIGGPAFDAITTFDSRLFGISSEDKNLLWYSKQIIENTPVEMSDLFTVYVAPNNAAQGPTGPMRCLAPMDDKLIIFKKNAIYYINGVGPDNTGANSQFSQPIFITSTVGCENQNSIVLTPNGLMFQSDKGIWLLGRDLSTNYIGKDVEDFNSDTVLSALAIPKTNQVRFTLSSGVTLMFDYFVSQWGTFTGIPGLSSTLYNKYHTYINQYGQAFQESPGTYLDGSTPVTISFTTGWISLAGLQGYKRLYKMFILGDYFTPHRLTMGIAHGYDSSIEQQATILPTNYSGVWGSGTSWGSVTFWGGSSRVEQWEIGFERQQCQSVQLTLNEYYDASMGVAAGAGLTLSGIKIVSGIKKDYPRDIGKANKTS